MRVRQPTHNPPAVSSRPAQAPTRPSAPTVEVPLAPALPSGPNMAVYRDMGSSPPPALQERMSWPRLAPEKKRAYGRKTRPGRARPKPVRSFSDAEDDNHPARGQPARHTDTERDGPVDKRAVKSHKDGVAGMNERGRHQDVRLDLEADGRGAAPKIRPLRLDDGRRTPQHVFPKPGRPRVLRNPPPPKTFPTAVSIIRPKRIRPTQTSTRPADPSPIVSLRDVMRIALAIVLADEIEIDRLDGSHLRGVSSRKRKRRYGEDLEEEERGVSTEKKQPPLSVQLPKSRKKRKVVVFGGTIPTTARAASRKPREKKPKQVETRPLRQLELTDVDDGPLTPPRTEDAPRSEATRERKKATHGKKALPPAAAPPPDPRRKTAPLPPRTPAPSDRSSRPAARQVASEDVSLSPAPKTVGALPTPGGSRRDPSESIASFRTNSIAATPRDGVGGPKQTSVQPKAKVLPMKSVNSTTGTDKLTDGKRHRRHLDLRGDDDEAVDESRPVERDQDGYTQYLDDNDNYFDDVEPDLNLRVPARAPGPAPDVAVPPAQPSEASRTQPNGRPARSSLTAASGRPQMRASVAYLQTPPYLLSMERVIDTVIIPHAQAASSAAAASKQSKLGQNILNAIRNDSDETDEVIDDYDDEPTRTPVQRGPQTSETGGTGKGEGKGKEKERDVVDPDSQDEVAPPVRRSSRRSVTIAKRRLSGYSEDEDEGDSRGRPSGGTRRSSSRLRDKRQSRSTDGTSGASMVAQDQSASDNAAKSSSSRLSSTFKAVKAANARPPTKPNETAKEIRDVAAADESSAPVSRPRAKKPAVYRKSTSTDHVSATPSPPASPVALPLPVPAEQAGSGPSRSSGQRAHEPEAERDDGGRSERLVDSAGPSTGQPLVLSSLVNRRLELSAPLARGGSQDSIGSSISSSAQRPPPFKSSLKRPRDRNDESRRYPPESGRQVRRRISWAQEPFISTAEPQRAPSQGLPAPPAFASLQAQPAPTRLEGTIDAPLSKALRVQEPQLDEGRHLPRKTTVGGNLDIPPFMPATSSSDPPAGKAKPSALARTVSQVLVPPSSLSSPAQARTPSSKAKRAPSGPKVGTRSPSTSLHPLPPPPPLPAPLLADASGSRQSGSAAPRWRSHGVESGLRSSSPRPRSPTSSSAQTPTVAARAPLPRDAGPSPAPRRSAPASKPASFAAPASGSSRKGAVKSVAAMSSGASVARATSRGENRDEPEDFGQDDFPPPVPGPSARRDYWSFAIPPGLSSSKSARGPTARKTTGRARKPD